MKQAMKESAPFQHEGIMSISRSLSGNVDAKVKKWVESAKRQGQDLDKMSEKEIKYLIELNKPKPPKVYSNEEAYEILNRFANQGKKDKGKVIEFPKDKITDWTKSQSRPPETEIISGIQTTRGLGDLFGKQLDRTVNVRIVIEDIKKLEPIEAMKEANKVLRGEGRYKSLSKADREKIVGDESVTDHIFERNIVDETEDFAQGGRTGFQGGKGAIAFPDEEDEMQSGLAPGRVLSGLGKLVQLGILGPAGMVTDPKKILTNVGTQVIGKKIVKPTIVKGIQTLQGGDGSWGGHGSVEAYDKSQADTYARAVDRHTGNGKSSQSSHSGGPSHGGGHHALKEGGRTGLSYLLAEDTNERMPFKMGRRAFLKLMGGVGAGIGALKTGALKLFGKEGATVAKELTQVPIKNIEGMPAWFKPLVNKVIKEGNDVSKSYATQERQIVHKTVLPDSKTDVMVTQDLSTGDVVVDIGLQKHGFPDGKFGQPVRLEYKASEEIEPVINSWTGKVDTKGKKTLEEFNVEEAEFTGGHPENVKFEETSINKFGEHESDFREIEKFAIGKNTVKGQIGSESKSSVQKYNRMGKSSTERKIDSWDKQNEDIADYFSNYPDPNDFASGGVAKMLGE